MILNDLKNWDSSHAACRFLYSSVFIWASVWYFCHILLKRTKTDIGWTAWLHPCNFNMVPKVPGLILFSARMPFGRHIFQVGPSGLLTSIIMIGWPLRSDWDVFLVRKIASLLDSTVCIGPTFSPFLQTFYVSSLQMYDSIFKLG